MPETWVIKLCLAPLQLVIHT